MSGLETSTATATPAAAVRAATATAGRASGRSHAVRASTRAPAAMLVANTSGATRNCSVTAAPTAAIHAGRGPGAQTTRAAARIAGATKLTCRWLVIVAAS